MSGTKVLLVGYNGANNTGAEALLLSDIELVAEHDPIMLVEGHGCR